MTSFAGYPAPITPLNGSEIIMISQTVGGVINTCSVLLSEAVEAFGTEDYGLPVTGAAFNGTTSDTAAWNAVYALAAETPQGGARIIVPPGSRIYTPGTVNYGSGLNVVDLNGAYQGTSSVYSTLNGQGSDLLISEHAGGLSWFRNASNSVEQPILVINGTTSNGGTGQPALVNIFHTITSGVTVAAPGSLIIQTTSSASGPSFSSLICVATKATGGSDCIATNFRAVDSTGGNSSTGGGLVVSEFDLNAQGIDNGGGPSGLNPGYGVRIGLQVLVRKPTGATSVEAAYALLVGGGNAQTYPNPDTTQWCKFVVAATGSVTMAAFDTTTAYMLATGSNALPDAYRMAAGQAIGFDGVTNSPNIPMRTPHQLFYNSSASAVQFTNSGAITAAITDFGGFNVGPGTPLATNATGGFLKLPIVSAAPTGTPATGGADQVYNTSTHSLNIYDHTAGSWYHLTMTAGAN